MEVIIAIAIISVGLLVLVSLLSFGISSLGSAENKMIAIGLAQEGIEITRNIRDTNWLLNKRSPSNWTDGLAAGNYRVQYNEASLLSFSNIPLKKDSNGVYQYNYGINTVFYRKISISHISNSQIKVVSEVSWSEKGEDYSVEIEDRFYNWLEE